MKDYEMKGYAIVVDTNKCVGCEACAVACKVWWTSKFKGLEHAWWIITETRPGRGYPKNWVEKTFKNIPPSRQDYEQPFKYRYENLINNPTNEIPPKIYPVPLPTYGPNWDWDRGSGNDPEDAWFFYLPLQCMHCDEAPCVEVCPAKAMYKREDGIVVYDPDLCISCQSCFYACPYRRIFWNYEQNLSSKCIMCAPLVDRGEEPICVRVCGARARYFGRLDDPTSPVYVLVREYKVALPLFPQFNTKPRVFYVPPLLTPPRPDGTPRYDKEYLEKFFGKEVWRVKEVLERERGNPNSKLMKILGGETYVQR